MNKVRLTALLTLLQDEDLSVASLAMEEFLKLGQAAEETIAEYQEAQDPQLRHRIHQLSSVLARRRSRSEFVEQLAREKLSLWEGLVAINVLYDSSCNAHTVNAEARELGRALRSGRTTTPQVAAVMREKGFTVPSEDILDVDLFLLDRVLTMHYGSAAVLCALARHVVGRDRWNATVVLHNGRFCLIDRNNLLLDPAEGWHISKLKTADRIHPCSRRDVLLGVLGQLFLVALVEGQLRDLYHFGSLLTSLNGSALDGLPFPLGAEAVPFGGEAK